MPRQPLRAALLAALLLLSPAARAEDGKPRVLATVGMIADVARNVAGDCAEIETLMGPGVDPHLYRASAGDVTRFRDADIILYSGYSLEGQLGEVLQSFSRQKPTVAVSPAAITPAQLISVQGLYGIDPHLWMDAGLWQGIAPVIAAELGKLAPACAADMQTRAETYQAQLLGLDSWARTSIASIPEAQRILVTAHDAFNYYGRAYGIEVQGIQGISTESEAGIADIRRMVDAVVDRKVPAVFIESTINPRTIQAVIEAAAERGHTIGIGGQLYSDAMGEAGKPDGTYIGMIWRNTSVIVTALGGTPAPLPPSMAPWAAQWGMETAEAGTEE
jgi:manganese/zinc/iron transport system substrate-binding protein